MWMFFNKYVLHSPRLVESVDVELWIQRADCKVILRFLIVWRVGAPNPHAVQRLTIVLFKFKASCCYFLDFCICFFSWYLVFRYTFRIIDS